VLLGVNTFIRARTQQKKKKEKEKKRDIQTIYVMKATLKIAPRRDYLAPYNGTCSKIIPTNQINIDFRKIIKLQKHTKLTIEV
jgi:hypothetical protein